MKQTQVTIIGGGIMGLSAAYQLTQAGFKVVVIDQDRIGAGASGTNAGMIRKGDAVDPLDHEIYQGSYQLYQHWSESGELGYDIELGEITLLRCFTDEHVTAMGAGQWKHRLETWEAGGLTLIPRTEWEVAEPHIASSITWGIETTSAKINIFRVCRGLAYATRQLGGEICPFTEALGIDVHQGRVRKVRTNRGDIRTDFVINAAGGWAGHVGDFVNHAIPILPALGTGLATESIPAITQHERLIYDPLWFNPHQPFQPCSNDPCQRLGVTTEIDRHVTENNYIIARSEHVVPLPQHQTKVQPEPETVQCIAASAIRLVPRLANIHIIRVYAGLRPVCEVDGKPILCASDTVEGFIIAAGPWHTGMSYGPMCGQLVVELVADTPSSIPLHELHLARFANQDHFPYIHGFHPP
jgi:glycine/D-amino acid oxidase-like deaminating enzyme